MPRFQFRLQQYLGVKEQIEDQKELEYAKALRVVEEEKQKLVELIQKRNDSVESLRQSVQKAISPVEIRRYNNNIERLKHQIVVQIERVAAAEAFAEQKRQELVQAMKERKALEIVKENAREEFLLEANLAEQKIVDELVSFKYSTGGE
jgi:flagellar FliJ protein